MKAVALFVIAGFAFASLLLVNNVEASVDDKTDFDEHLWRHQLKKTYCEAIQTYRIYKVENLSVHCAGKVSFFDEQVSLPKVKKKSEMRSPFSTSKKVESTKKRIG